MKLWIDTDAGVDDATAILIALAAPDVEIVGISCVGGNAYLENVIRNVNRTMQVFGKKGIPVYAGCKRALVHPPMVIPEIHGVDGLGDIKDSDFGIDTSTTSNYVQGIHASTALLNYLKSQNNEDDIVVMALGPLTNLAIALRMDEETFVKDIKHLVIMGGAEDGVGNTSPYAEFNFRCDPEAAKIIFDTFPQSKATMSSWTLTQKFSFKTEEDLAKFQGKTDTLIGRFIHETWKCIIDFTKGDMLMADPIASFICCYGEKAVKVAERLRIDIVLEGEKVGMSLATPDEENGCIVVKEIDFDLYKEKFMELMCHH
ncbi:Inosine-uridine preferring nucleoside hydrolase family protein [Tritrichomonas foetus]|uniref:Inosine-uridine preferring nucleoside hydrolase family protein n=1 Tax=Tritrichomonas foetus TaxID=1144522 RepID=A0A1J4JWJ8_9EUKA|nr:Inosine-uridine preferring nucleoside hydrolase family protein [Tritrichomonas foetus]|eukprot:OHT01908.1 Inosine-uridine preferring nucleoside hydrolase family protein [Tritrichomonas foetus]